MRIARWGLVLLLASWGGIAGARQEAQTQPAQQQSQQASDQNRDQKQADSLAAAARHAREEKKQQPKAARVYDNDDLPTQGLISVVGEAKPATENASAAEKAGVPSTKSAPSKKSGTDEARKAELELQLADAKQHLQSVTTDLDIASRKYALDQQTYYGKPDFSSDEQGAAALQIEGKLAESEKQEAADAQKKVDDLTEKLKELESKD